MSNDAALQAYEERQEKNEKEYNQMLEDLRRTHHDEWPDIIEEYGYGDVDPVDILKDL